ncbi:MAG: TOBE domain-containing protein, partial [Pararhodobacter sp.]
HDGVVKQAGAPLELYDTPANLFVAGFIGSPSMNFFEATMTGGMLHLADGQITAAPAGVALAEGQAVLLGIRPEDLTIAETGLEATIDVVEPTGAEIHVNATLGGKPMTAVFRERHDLVPGQTIRMAARAGRLHLFDPKTEMRLN